MQVLASNKHVATQKMSRRMGPGLRRDDIEYVAGLRGSGCRTKAKPYASPSVSNIAALSASAVDLPAHTTNWNAGK